MYELRKWRRRKNLVSYDISRPTFNVTQIPKLPIIGVTELIWEGGYRVFLCFPFDEAIPEVDLHRLYATLASTLPWHFSLSPRSP